MLEEETTIVEDDGDDEVVETPESISREAYDALIAEKASLEEDFNKLKEKDHNFSALRKKQLGELTPEEQRQYLGDQMEEMETKQAEYRTQQRNERIDDALDVFAGDEDQRKKFEFYFNNDKRSEGAVSAKDIQKLMKEYMPLVTGKNVMDDSFNRAATHYNGAQPRKEVKRFADTEAGEALAKDLGLGTQVLSQAAGKGLKVNNPNN